MRNPLLIAGLLVVAANVAIVAPAGAAQSVDSLAREECRDERRFDRADFQRDYGTGKAAFTRCVKDELR